ncbi:hypothetical protein FE257_007246 [Aspergillus nanangensis]|uniref:Uncharacterized protein n=1 Tax=Aspergillus nanangensis TaxID=2582783 RepID=A0AAD4CN44_ASPNN|nr:hypothetical protein FE257_007246 [Aspergillus nanangensis]
MPGLTLHLLALSTEVSIFLQTLRQTRDVVVASRPRHVVVRPEHLDATTLSQTPWDLLVLLRPLTNGDDDDDDATAIPKSLQPSITSEYKVTVGIPSKLLTTYAARDNQLKASASTAPLTGSLDSARARSSSQSLEVSPDLLDFMDSLTAQHNGPVTMLNLLHFHPDGKKSYFQYGQAFVPVAGKRGGDAKLVGNVVPPAGGGGGDSRGSADRPAEDWWNEVSIVHYPSIRHFCDMLAGEDYQAINEKYRLAALRDTFLLCTTEFDVEKTAAAAKL